MISIGDDQFLTIVGSLGAVFNGLGRLIFGMLLDRFSFRVLSAVINGILMVSAFSFSLIGETKWLFLIAVALTYFVYGGNYSIYPTHTVRILGNEIGSKIYYLVFIGFSVGNLSLRLRYSVVICRVRAAMAGETVFGAG